MELVNKSLINIFNENGVITSSDLRKLIVHVHRFYILLLKLFPAMVAPKSDFCWQKADSECGDFLNEIVTVVNLKNERNYRIDLHNFLDIYESESVALYKDLYERRRLATQIREQQTSGVNKTSLRVISGLKMHTLNN